MLPGRSQLHRHGRSKVSNMCPVSDPHKPLEEVLTHSQLVIYCYLCSSCVALYCSCLTAAGRRLYGHFYPSPNESGGYEPYKHLAFNTSSLLDWKRFGWTKCAAMCKPEGTVATGRAPWASTVGFPGTAQPGVGSLPRAEFWIQCQETCFSCCFLINGHGDVVLEWLGTKCAIITSAPLLA